MDALAWLENRRGNAARATASLFQRVASLNQRAPICYIAPGMTRYTVVRDPRRIPVPGEKLIEEYFGRIRTGTDAFSLAHMVTPPGWSEPPQVPRFGELTIMIRGRMRIEVEAEVIELGAREAIWIEPEVRVRYSNPYPEQSEYFAVCIPAFSPELARRDSG